MGSSTVSLQSVVDLMKTMGSVSVSQAAGGFSALTWLAIGNDVLNDLVSQKFNWKWNSFKLPPFYTISYQTDYATVNQVGIGWIENGTWEDVNNTALPKPSWTIEAVRDLQPTSFAASPPTKICWRYNNTLKQADWPGANVIYTNPLGAVSTPANPRTNILDASGNILLLTTYGTTGATAPNAGVNAAIASTVIDGTCVWTVCNPFAQGYRLIPMPPQSGVVYKIEPIGQRNPPRFTTLKQNIDPVPDDYASSFITGVYTYCHKYSTDPNLKKEFPTLRAMWLADIMSALKQGDRETDNAGFVPSRSVMASGDSGDVGPANPYGNGWPGWSGR
jgi:hypothetical protein